MGATGATEQIAIELGDGPRRNEHPRVQANNQVNLKMETSSSSFLQKMCN